MQNETPLAKFNFSLALLAGFAVINFLPIEFPFRHTHPHTVRYDTDGELAHCGLALIKVDHDVCRAAIYQFVILLMWYFSLLVSLIRNKHAVDSAWGMRLMIYPNVRYFGFNS